MKKFGRAQRSYLKGLDIAETYLGPEHSITAAYTSSWENLASRLDSQARTASISRTVQRGGLAVTKSRMRRKGGGELEGVYRRGK